MSKKKLSHVRLQMLRQSQSKDLTPNRMNKHSLQFSTFFGEYKSSKKMPRSNQFMTKPSLKQKSPARTQKVSKCREPSPVIKKAKKPMSQVKNKSSTQKDISLLLRGTRHQFRSKRRESSTKSPKLRQTAKRTDRLSQVSFSQGYSSRKGKAKEQMTPFQGPGNWAPGQVICGRYETLSLLGEGAFGVVIRCLDRKSRKEVAVKVIEYTEESREVAECEVEMLTYLKQCKGCRESSVIVLKDNFQTKEHIVSS